MFFFCEEQEENIPYVRGMVKQNGSKSYNIRVGFSSHNIVTRFGPLKEKLLTNSEKKYLIWWTMYEERKVHITSFYTKTGKIDREKSCVKSQLKEETDIGLSVGA